MPLPFWALFASFGAMLSWGVADYLIQKSTRKIGNIETLAFIGRKESAGINIPELALHLLQAQRLPFLANTNKTSVLFWGCWQEKVSPTNL